MLLLLLLLHLLAGLLERQRLPRLPLGELSAAALRRLQAAAELAAQHHAVQRRRHAHAGEQLLHGHAPTLADVPQDLPVHAVLLHARGVLRVGVVAPDGAHVLGDALR